MDSETKQCQNCQGEFTIEPEDFQFYEKIQVPPPTWCPECRAIRRRVWRNERSLHRRKCDLCAKDVIAMYPANAPFPVYCQDCWNSDKWDSLAYGREYDFSRPFFEQFHELQNVVPRNNLGIMNNKNSPYINYVWNSNNCYMCLDMGYGENCLYCNACHFFKDSADNSYCKKLELCYACIDSRDSTRSDSLEKCENCLDSHFLWDCKGCSSCILCAGLRNQKYCILNQQYSKEEYEEKKKEYVGGSFLTREKSRALFDELKLQAIHRENSNIQAAGCTGDNIWNSNRCFVSFNVYRSQNCKFVNDIDSDMKDSMDLSNAAEGELLYEGTSLSGSGLRFDVWVVGMNIEYSSLCIRNAANLFGCIGVNNKSYCILNKQYSEAEYASMVERIKEQMREMPYHDKQGRVYTYGEFFPIELSVFPYNESKSQEYHPLTKEKAALQGYRWSEPEERHYAVTKQTADLPDGIDEVLDSITSDVIACSHGGSCGHTCSTAFKITPEELLFYRRMRVPLPRVCPNCRYHERMGRRNPMRLWPRQCMCKGNGGNHAHGESPCSVEFQTTYAPGRPEIIYCESCYNSEIN